MGLIRELPKYILAAFFKLYALPLELFDRLNKSPYWIRFSFLVLASAGINAMGLFATERIGWSLIFFDMIGTAVASLLGGTAAGIMTAILSSALGSWGLGSIDYLIFGYVNTVGAIVWSMLPRTGRPLFGCYVFNLTSDSTYSRAFRNILLLGFVTGISTSISAWVINEFILSGHQIYVFGSTTMAGKNNSALSAGLIEIVRPSSIIGKYFIDFISSLITNLPDKIIATAVAVFIIVSYRTLPNFKAQKSIIRSGKAPNGTRIVANKTVLIILCSLQFFAFPITVWVFTSDLREVFYMGILSIFVVLIFFPADAAYTKSIDRPQPQSGRGNKAFYPFPDGFHLGHHKAVFEDLLKLMAIAVSGTSFLIAMGVSGPCTPETAAAVKECGPLYELAAVNALIITGFRYVCVVIMRLSNRHEPAISRRL